MAPTTLGVTTPATDIKGGGGVMRGYLPAEPVTPFGTTLQLSGQPLKDWLVTESIRHREADEYIAGAYGKTDQSGKWRGCAVGCTLASLNGRKAALNDHKQYERIGIPEWVALFQDSMFERLANEERVTWPERFYAAIPIGCDWKRVWHRFAIYLMEDEAHFDAEKYPDVAQSRATIAELHHLELVGETQPDAAWSAAESAAANAAASAWSARSAAESAALSAAASAWSARSAAESAAESAARDAAASAWSARSAAESAALSAAASARSAAESAVRNAITRISGRFLEICKEEEEVKA